MKILVLPRRRAGVPVEAFQPHITAEIEAVWDLYAQGICREFYARADQVGPAVLTLECASIEAAKVALTSLPMVELGLLELDLVPLAPFTHLTQLFQAAS